MLSKLQTASAWELIKGSGCTSCLKRIDFIKESVTHPLCRHRVCRQCYEYCVQNESYNCPTCLARCKNDQSLDPIQLLPFGPITFLREGDKQVKKVKNYDAMLEVKERFHNLCHQHRQQPLNFFCKTCKVPVCRDCTVVSHKENKGHEVTEISEALKEFSPQFNNTRDRAKNISKKLQTRSNMSEKAMEQLTKNEANERRQIRNVFAGYHAQLDEKEKALLSQLTADISRDKEEIEDLRDLFDDQVSTFTKLDEQFEEAREQEDIRQLFDVVHQMKNWEKTSTGLTNGKDERKWYKYRSENEDAFRSELFQLGNIEKKHGLLQQTFVTEPALFSGPGSVAGFQNASGAKCERSKTKSSPQGRLSVQLMGNHWGVSQGGVPFQGWD